MAGQLSFSNEVFSYFAFYGTVVTVKMLLMAFLTAKHRIGKGVFANEEDCKSDKRRELKPIFNDPDVERVRRNHLNDLENIPPFLLLGFVYVLTGPSPYAALLHFRIFAASRILHTIAYQLPLPQPSRALAFFAGVGVNLSMAAQILMVAKW